MVTARANLLCQSKSMKYLLIGGLNATINTKKIQQTILEEVTNPKIVYVTLASQKYELSLADFKRKIGVRIETFTRDDLKVANFNKLKEANVFFFAGGCANDLISLVKEYNLLPYFLDSKVEMLAGVSAGAIMLAAYGMGDKDAFMDCGHFYNFKMVKGLGLLPIIFCPHYQKEELVLFDDEVKKYPYDAYALEDETALLFYDNKLVRVIKNEMGMACYYLKRDKNYLLIPLYERNL